MGSRIKYWCSRFNVYEIFIVFLFCIGLLVGKGSIIREDVVFLEWGFILFWVYCRNYKLVVIVILVFVFFVVRFFGY